MLWKLLFLVSITIGLGYPLWCIWYFKQIPTTISATWYDHKVKNEKLIWLFQIWAWGTMYTLAPFIFKMSDFQNLDSAIGCMICCMLFFVGFFPKYREHQGYWHYTCAFLCALFAFTWACLLDYQYVPLWYLAMLPIGALAKPDSAGYFAELVAFLSMYTVIGLNLWQTFGHL